MNKAPSTIQPSPELLERLNGVIRKTKFCEAVFGHVARRSEKTSIRHSFTDLARERRRLAFELQGVVADLGEEPEKGETREESIPPGLQDDVSLLQKRESELAELLALEEYEELLSSDEAAPPKVGLTLRQQLETTREALELLTVHRNAVSD